jgi:hypothetical protein
MIAPGGHLLAADPVLNALSFRLAAAEDQDIKSRVVFLVLSPWSGGGGHPVRGIYRSKRPGVEVGALGRALDGEIL